MSSPKQLGAKQMFEQSLVYLYNSYREDGLTPDEAKERVAMHIEEMQVKYQSSKLVPMKKKDYGISNPVKIVDEVIEVINDVQPVSIKQSAVRKLYHLKQILGGR